MLAYKIVREAYYQPTIHLLSPCRLNDMIEKDIESYFILLLTEIRSIFISTNPFSKSQIP